MTGYNNDVSLGSVALNTTLNGWENTFDSASGLTASIFQNVDEVRITPQVGNEMWIGLNNIEIGDPVIPMVNSVSVTPSSASLLQGGSQQLTASVNVSGGAAQTVNWTSSDGTNKVSVDSTGKVTVAAAAAPGNYTITAASTADNSKYGTSVITVNALTNAAAPSITTQPSDRTVNVGSSANLAVAATASGTVSYQWYRNTTNSTTGGTLIAGEEGPAFSAPTAAFGTTYYYAVVTNTDTSMTGTQTAAATSSVAKVTVNALTHAAAPSITTQPADRTVNEGGSANLTVAATASGTVSYQWYRNTTNSTTGGTLIAGEEGPAFNAPTAAPGTTYYYAVVTNTDTSMTGTQTAAAISSTAKVTVNALTHAAAPSITTQPADRTVNEGGSANLTVAATASGTVSYQWYRNTTNSTTGGTLIAGEEGPAFSAPTAAPGTTYYYTVVTNTDTSMTGTQTAAATSSVAKVTVNALTHAAAPSIMTQPSDRTVNVGGSANLTVVATASGTISYQWYRNTTNSTTGGTLIAGEEGSAFSAPTAAPGTTYYYAVVTNTDTSMTGTQTAAATSSAAKVTVNALTHAAAPSITTQPTDRTVNEGGSANLTVAATASGTVSYQWYRNTTNSTTGGTLIAGEEGSTFSAATAAPGTTYYYAVVTNTDTSMTGTQTAAATSSAAKVTVNALTHAAAPSITTQPADRTVNVGGSANLTVAATASGTVSYQWYRNTTNSTTGGTLIAGEEGSTFSAPTAAPGTTYYYAVVTNTDTSMTGTQTAAATSSVAKVTVNALTHAAAPSITTQPADRTVNEGGSANLTVVATASGTISYQWYRNTTNSTTGGTLIAGEEGSTFSAPTAAPGTTYYYAVVTNTDTSMTGTQTAAATSSAAKVTVNALANSTTQSSATTGVYVLVNGKVENAGTATISQQDGQTVTTIAVDEKKLEQRLVAEGSGTLITIPVNMETDVVAGELNGRMVKSMENKQATVEIRTLNASYTLPAKLINIDAITSQIGSNAELQDIKIKLQIAKSKTKTVKVVGDAASSGNFTLVVPALEFTVSATYGEKTVEVRSFNAYVERTIAIPDGVDPKRITTGVVVDPDGMVRHVPTKIILIDGKYYAKINSLTNSTYTVVWHPLEFSDVAKHWAKQAINDMGSRMVVKGFQDGTFKPNQDMTRAEFAAIMVRGLGLRLDTGKAPFTDVQLDDWFSAAVQTASAYKLIDGFEDGTFRPNDKITREQAMVIIAKAMKISGLQGKMQVQDASVMLNDFADANHVSVWAKDSVSSTVLAGIVSGKYGKVVDPKAHITRAEVAIMIRNLLIKSDLI
ncbi:S-layer homology domain-containing protein [Paenibacillus gansuensis]|uniref:S-layer homology domain-containing protein n=1 Tax=Paenibacillus gansuensis TaxID=306542 RepID=A0ABW5PKF1_9BACL